MDEPTDAAAGGPDEVTDDGVFHAVLDGYDAVYGALPQSRTFNDIWRTNAYDGEFPEQFAHIGFLTLDEGARLVEGLRLQAGSVLVDVACGHGGPGLWAAHETGATLVGVDPSSLGIEVAQERAELAGLAGRATFRRGTFEQTGLADGIADAVMTIEAFQYAPDKRAALVELHRILRPGGRLGIVCFEVDPAKVGGVPVLGVDPVVDYSALLRETRFAIELYEETPGWEGRVHRTFSALIDASDALAADLGDRAAASTLAEAMITVELRPYPRRVLVVARRV